MHRIPDAEIRALKFIYDAFALGTQPKQPNGTGSFSVTLQRSTLTLDRINYFNRGAEVWSSGLKIHDIWQMPDSTVEGYVAASVRPLSALKLPFFADVDTRGPGSAN